MEKDIIVLTGPIEPDYPELFKTYIVQVVQTTLIEFPKESSFLGQEMRERAMHALSYALGLEEAWSDAYKLVIEIAPRMEKAGHRNDWIPYLEKSWAISQAEQDDAATAQISLQLGLLFQLRGDFGEAYSYFEISVEKFAVLNDFRQQAKALSWLAFVAYLQHRYEKAHGLVNTAISLINKNDTILVDGYRVKGRIAFDQQDWESAIKYFQLTLTLSLRENIPRRVANALRDLGPALYQQGNITEAIRCHEEAIALFEQEQDFIQQAVTQMNLGTIFLLQGAMVQALAYYEKAESQFRNVHDLLHLAIVKTNIGIVYRRLTEWKKANQYFLAAVNDWSMLNDKSNLINVLYELGTLYLNQGLRSEAAKAFETALQRLPEIQEQPNFEDWNLRLRKCLQEVR